MRVLRSESVFRALALPYELLTRTTVWDAHCARMALELPPAARRIVDLGCGPGNSTVTLPRGAIGGDAAMPMLRRALRRGVPAVCLDASALPFASGALDAVTFHSVLYLVPDREAALREVARALRAGGRVVLLEPHTGVRAGLSGLAWALLRPRWFVTAATWRVMQSFYGGFRADELRALLVAAGLRVVRIEEALGGLALLAVAERLA